MNGGPGPDQGPGARGQGPENTGQRSDSLIPDPEHRASPPPDATSDTPAPGPWPPAPDQAPGPWPPAPIKPPAPEQARVFWGYSDLFLFAGLAVPAMLAGFGLVKALLYVSRLNPSRAAEVLIEQFIGYLFLFL